LAGNGHGSWVTLNFGEPTLTVEEPRPRPVFLGKHVPRKLVTRTATVRGPWWLWIDCAYWSLAVERAELAHCESDRTTIARALHILEGQALSGVDVEPDGRTTFAFDLGCVLATGPAPAGWYDRKVPLWHLYQPEGQVLTVRSDGCYVAGAGDTPRDEEIWSPLAGGPEHVDDAASPAPTRPWPVPPPG